MRNHLAVMVCHQGDWTETIVPNKEVNVQNSGLKLLCFKAVHNMISNFTQKKVIIIAAEDENSKITLQPSQDVTP